MNANVVSAVTREVFRRFPEMRGVRPKILPYAGAKKEVSDPPQKYLLIFQKQVQATPARKLPYVVRVIVNSDGKILRMTMSR